MTTLEMIDIIKRHYLNELEVIRKRELTDESAKQIHEIAQKLVGLEHESKEALESELWNTKFQHLKEKNNYANN